MSIETGQLSGIPLSEEEWKRHRLEAVASLPAEYSGKELPDILMPFQKQLMLSTANHQLTVAEKSRRTGATWGEGADAVLTSAATKVAGGMDTIYIGYNLDMAREFIDTCGMWARAFHMGAMAMEEFVFSSEPDEEIQAFRIRFASGFEIKALSSRPRSLRGQQGFVILDEFAFHDDPEGLLKAAMALTIWGGKVLVISTHNGAENAFNRLIEDIRSGKQPGNIVRCTFDEAVEQGLFARVCLVTGKPYSVEAEAAWRERIRKLYRANAGEELDCVPNEGTGVYIPRVLVEACTDPQLLPVLRLNCDERFVMKPEDFRVRFVQEWLDREVAPRIALLDPRCQHAFGQDFARNGDLSVMAVEATLASLHRTVPLVIELRRVPFEQQKQIAFFILDRLPRRGAAKLDARGNGQYLAEVVMQRYGEGVVECVMLSQSWYRDNMPKLKAVFEDRVMAITADDYLVSDVVAIRLLRGVPMVPDKYEGEDRDGGKRHADFAVALALAHAASLTDVVAHSGYQGLARNAGIFGKPADDARGGFRMRADDSTEGGGSRFGNGAF